jgi:uncharacterized protein (DUF983 family)
VARSLAFACPSCGASVEGPLAAEATCSACGTKTALPEAAQLEATGAADVCPVCGAADLYQQRDFSRRVGLALAAIGLLTGPFTHWISTVAFIALDAGLYLLVPVVAVCYACEAQQRGVEKAHLPEKFEIAIHDVYRFGKRFPPRRDAAVAGPRARLLATEGKVTPP